MKVTGMYEANVQLLYYTKFVYEQIVIPAVACSLFQNCIACPGSQLGCKFVNKHMLGPKAL